ncbi:protoporphyrinogen oxidase HemJ [Palleronia sp. LCG004]|uniref:protoporphyrinogen oxidase HemJ n=1 Tax=Palleronia sp. LCG004 TaxID=3079304 RepID=UPI002943C864|nr:protoporphyrinogen oxidase HemJ [Palleronia sp. LCG004]WOI55940.1 protoporphyrinogen oxidase HemJ [Palleronia sp. LCG004]
MTETLSSLYPWIKSLHVIAFVAWMAGLFYLPRLFVYHAEQARIGTDKAQMLETMERRLLRAIMNPAMIVTWLAGLTLVMTPGVVDWGSVWPWTKAAGVLTLTWFHMWCAGQRKALAAGDFSTSGRRYRIMNEVPTLLLILIVVSVIARPF